MNNSDQIETLLILDTETTGFKFDEGHKIIEIGIVEVVDRVITGRHYHQYINPQRDIPEDATKVHGLSIEEVLEKSGGRIFSQIVMGLFNFIGTDGKPHPTRKNVKLVAHNAGFDQDFIDSELQACGFPTLAEMGFQFIDSLEVARNVHKKGNHKLDTLAAYYLGANTYERKFHGALLDADILARVYLAMTVSQKKLVIDNKPTHQIGPKLSPERLSLPSGTLRTANVTSSDLERHEQLCERVRKSAGGKCLADSLSF